MMTMHEHDFIYSLVESLDGAAAVYNSSLEYICLNAAAAGSQDAVINLRGKGNKEWGLLNNVDAAVISNRDNKLNHVLSTGVPASFDEQINSDIHRRYMRYSLKPFMGNSGEKFLLMHGFPLPEWQTVAEDELALISMVHAQELTATGNWQFFERHCYTVLSSGASRILGLDPAFTPGTEALLELVSLRDRIALRRAFTHLLETGTELKTEVIFQLNIVRKPVMIRAKRITVTDGSYALIGSLADITPQKRIETDLKNLEEHLNQTSELARTASFEFDIHSKNIYWSPGLYRIFEKDPASGPPTVDEYYSRVHPEDRAIAESILSEVKHSVASITREFRIITYLGNEKHLQVVTQPSSDNDGRVGKIIGSAADITSIKRTEDRLRLSEQHLLEAQQMSRSGSWELNLLDRSIIWSPGVYRMLGLHSRQSVSVDEYYSWIEPGEVERVRKLTGALYNGEPYEAEYTLTVPGQKQVTVLSRGKSIRNAEGKYVRAIGTLTDITAQTQVRKALIETKRQSDDMMRAKEYFLANISHELKTPLNGILGMARLLQKTALNPTQRNYIDLLNSTAGNLLVIINDILDIAKIESGTMSLERIPFDPAKISDTAVQIQLYKAEEKDLVLRHLHIGDAMPPVTGDPYRLSQVLLNLLSNAIKFTDQGEIELTHRIIEMKNNKVWIEFSVKDTGVGISPEHQQSVFESFMQAHESNAGQYGGTGLGLTISRNLVEMQGGTIGVDSIPGKGSRFYFSIPYDIAAALDQDQPHEIDLKKLGSLRILLAEDNRVNQFITEAMLLDWGFRVDIAVNGIEAVEMLRKADYDLVLMDIQMPEMNGSEATKIIRGFAEQRKANIPIIALTANTSRQAQRKFISEGMNDCLVKPFKEELLFKRIIAQLEGDERVKSAITRPRFPTRRKPLPSGDQLYNLSLLKRDARDNPVFIKKMLNIFIDSIPPIIERMKEQFEKGEMDAIAGLAHKIKPTLDGAGIVSLWDTIRNMENYREKKRSREQMRTDLQQLNDVINAVINAFRKELEILETVKD